MLLTSLITVASETSHEPAVSRWYIGIGVFIVLLALLGGLVAFGGGRDHS